MQTVIVAAAILIEDTSTEGDPHVLLTQRKAGGHLAGAWEFPGGKVEPGEDPKRALVRELKEEVGISARVGEILDVTFHRYDDAGKAVLLLFYEVARTADSPPPEVIDVAALRWAAADELHESEFPPADVAILAKVRRKLG
ncbi:MAG TPA: (deoxy)nucleoside triphosphate pyrophosphohydrolase [Polyangiaceae bacterium]|nr:(deoxy)nucleoside triphosphate pyrophosphohydrolase [Polyangiaceae bacterium]